MHKLLLIRHAKSSHKFFQLDDHDRPLNERGERDAIKMARWLANSKESLDVIYSSTARRSLKLAERIHQFTGTLIDDRSTFYTFNERQLLDSLTHLPSSHSKVAVVGHNPAITYVANYLTRNNIDNIPTSGIVAIDCNILSWNELENNVCKLNYFVYPKMLNVTK